MYRGENENIYYVPPKLIQMEMRYLAKCKYLARSRMDKCEEFM